MSKEHVRHILDMSMEEGRIGNLILTPALDEKAYGIGVQVLRLVPYRDWNNPDQRIAPDRDEEATEYKLVVDSERHLNGRANCLFEGLREAGVDVELGDSVSYI